MMGYNDIIIIILIFLQGTAKFLSLYLSERFKDANVDVLNCRQGRLERRKVFNKVLVDNVLNTNKKRKPTTRLVKNILISTQLNSRGIDFSCYSHVINYSCPHDLNSYIHKSGRVGRAGNAGICITMIENKNLPAFKRVIINKLPIRFHNVEPYKGYLCTKDVDVDGNRGLLSGAYK